MSGKADTVSAYRRRGKAIHNIMDAAVAELKADSDASWKAARAARNEREATRVRFTGETLEGVLMVQDDSGWHLVVRVNKVTVTVKSSFGPMMIANSKILARHPEVTQ